MRKASLRLVVKYDYKLLEWGPETVGNALPPLLVLEIVSLEAYVATYASKDTISSTSRGGRAFPTVSGPHSNSL